MNDRSPNVAPDKDAYGNSFAHLCGWFALICALVFLPLAITAVRTFSTLPGFAGILLLLSLPATILLVIGGVGLLKKRAFGFFLLYVVIFFGQFGGFKTPLIPFVKRFLNVGYWTNDLFLLINLVVAAFLLRDHLFFLQPGPVQRRKIYGLWGVGLAFIILGQLSEVKQKGSVQSLQELPLLGNRLEPLATKGTIEFQLLHQKLQKSLVQVASGESDAESIAQFANKHGLKQLDAEQVKKVLPFVKQWKLDPSRFPQQFDTNDLGYVGRLTHGSKMTLQLGFDHASRRFALQALGSLEE